jgi:CRP-like cAMP-binding protein
MSAPNQSAVQNRLLRLLPGPEFVLLQPRLEPVQLDVRHVLVVPNEPIEQLYFIEQGLGSVVATATDGSRLEVGLFGRDGISGTSTFLGVDRTPHETFMQMAGSGLRIETAALQELLVQCPALQTLLLKFVQVFTVQTAHTAVANGSYNIEQRLARWLLMSHDRVGEAELPLTHEFLAIMLAVRRSGVTVATQVLEGQHIIRAERGRITVLDRTKLEEAAGGSYGVPEAEYERLIGPLR